MNPTFNNATRGYQPLHGFTRLELFAAVIALGLITNVIIAAVATSNRQGDLAMCSNNLRRIGLGYTYFGLEHNDLNPWNVGMAEGGNFDYPASTIPGLLSKNNLYVQYSVLSNYLDTPFYLADPGDPRPSLRPARFWSIRADGGLYNFNYQQNSLSYFLGVDGGFHLSRSVLAGDRNLPVFSGVTTCSSGIGPVSAIDVRITRWTNDVHGLSGNLLFYDGSVRHINNSAVREVLGLSDQSSNPYPWNRHTLHPF
jgi:prepilin-type processing-associated H-X9-DG protein